MQDSYPDTLKPVAERELYGQLEEDVLEAIHQFEIRYSCVVKSALAGYRKADNGRVEYDFNCYFETFLNKRNAISQEPFSVMDWRTAGILASPTCRSHIVYPYTDDRHLVDAVGFYTASGLASDGAVVLIVTEAHRDAIKRYLKRDGNVEALEASGQLTFLDAAELTSTFMLDGMPDPVLFKTGIKTLIARVRRDERPGSNRQVRFFGEMVNLLWPTNSAAVERLEELWNEMVEEISVPIFHAYSVDGSGGEQLSESLINAHSHAIAW